MFEFDIKDDTFNKVRKSTPLTFKGVEYRLMGRFISVINQKVGLIRKNPGPDKKIWPIY